MYVDSSSFIRDYGRAMGQLRCLHRADRNDEIKEKYPNEPFILLDNYTKDPRLRYRRGDSNLTEGTVKDLLEKQDYTDIFVLVTYQRQKRDLSCSWATRNPGGLTDDHIKVLEKTKNVFFLVLCTFCKDIIAKTLLTVYLGADPGARVHEESVSGSTRMKTTIGGI